MSTLEDLRKTTYKLALITLQVFQLHGVAIHDHVFILLLCCPVTNLSNLKA